MISLTIDGITFGVIGPVALYRGFRTMRTRRLIANTPTARVRSMAMGLVEVEGITEPRSAVAAPFSGRSCVYWEIDVSTPTRNGWNIVHRNHSGNPFYLRDQTGLALIYPDGSECKIPFGTSEECLGLNLPPCYAEYLSHHARRFSMMRLGRLRFRERALEAGVRVYVLGTATPHGEAQVVADGEELLATGTDDAAVTRLRTLDHEVRAVIRRGENERAFMISQDSERGLMVDLGLRELLQLVGGAAATLYGVASVLLATSSGH